LIIESYEPYHIGLKLYNYVDRGLLTVKIYKHFETKPEEKYELNDEIISGIKSVSPIITIVTDLDSKTIIQMNFAIGALNIVGSDPKSVYELFIDLFKALPELGFELESTFSFFEIISHIILKVEEKPQDIFKKFVSIDFSKEIGIPDINVNFVRFSNLLSPREEDTIFQLEVIPNPTSPNTRLILRIVYRIRDIEAFKSFHIEFDKTIKGIYKKIIEV